MKFYDREKEMDFLRGLKGGFFVAVVGRRRVGKTRLVNEAFPNRIYLFVPEDKEENIIALEWSEEVKKHVPMPESHSITEILEFLFRSGNLVFIDEFQNLEKVRKGMISDIQRLVDTHKENLRLVIAGSYVSIMKKMLTDSRNPLFGRVDFIMKLKELDFPTVFRILSDLGYGMKDAVEFHSVLGGMPKYYEILEKTRGNPRRFIERMFIEEPAPFRYEGEVILRNEIGSEYRNYFSILEALSIGKNTMNEISDYLGKESKSITKYMDMLVRDYELVRRKAPVTEDFRRSKNGRYFIVNPFFRFWSYFVHRNISIMEEGDTERAKEVFERDFDQYVSIDFEEIATDIVRNRMNYQKVGSWWNRRGDEIDIVALNERNKEILFGEVKWRNRKIGCDVLDKLMEKKEIVKWNNEDRKERFLMVSKSGFTKKCLERMDDGGIMHWDLKDIENFLQNEKSLSSNLDKRTPNI
jgi:AAA+ ATPase superfamily predicted ATPase